jgi:hypothetical protein
MEVEMLTAPSVIAGLPLLVFMVRKLLLFEYATPCDPYP